MDSTQSTGNTTDFRPGLTRLTAAEIAYLESYLTQERLHKIARILHSRRQDIIPVAYSLYDPYNEAAIMRTCEALGLQEVHFIDEVGHHRCPKCCTKGCEKWLTIQRHKDYQSCANHLRQRGYKILVADMDGTPIDQLNIRGQVALIAGSEHAGVPAALREDADQIISIPMCGFSQSMNVSVSMAILLSAILARRGFTTSEPLPEEQQQELYQHWLIRAVPHATELLEHYRANKSQIASNITDHNCAAGITSPL